MGQRFLKQANGGLCTVTGSGGVLQVSGKAHDQKRVRLEAGEYHVSGSDVVLHTLLGSCVSACLYDPIQRIIGMNHFLVSDRRYEKSKPFPLTEAGRYGVHAMELLINAMLRAGAERKNLHAKAFGGGTVLNCSAGADSVYCVGDANARFIREFLANEGIPLVSADLGGDRGRVIYFYHDDFSVYVRKIQKTIGHNVAQREKQFWQWNRAIQEQTATVPDLWI